jgi:hypothetical protein
MYVHVLLGKPRNLLTPTALWGILCALFFLPGGPSGTQENILEVHAHEVPDKTNRTGGLDVGKHRRGVIA